MPKRGPQTIANHLPNRYMTGRRGYWLEDAADQPQAVPEHQLNARIASASKRGFRYVWSAACAERPAGETYSNPTSRDVRVTGSDA
jgi:hypothetical protein